MYAYNIVGEIYRYNLNSGWQHIETISGIAWRDGTRALWDCAENESFVLGGIEDGRVSIYELNSTVPYCDTDINEGLVAHYTFDGNAYDYSGYGNNGTVRGGLQWIAGGINGGAASFNGQDSYVEVADSQSLSFTGSFSLACWVKFQPGQYFRTGLIKKLPPTHPAHGFSLNMAEKYPGSQERIATIGIMDLDPTGPLGDSGGGVGSDTVINDDKWHHIVATYDQQVIRLYVNGTMENETVYLNGFTPNDIPLYIGNYPYAYNDGHGNLPNIPNGLMDEVRIYNRVLTDSEIRELSDRSHAVGSWATPVMLPSPINENASDEAPFPFESGGRELLYFTSNRSGGEGMTDIYVSENVGGNWTTPDNLSTINGSGYEQSASLTADGNELYFHSNSYGNDDIYVSVKDGSGNWTSPQKVADGLISTGSQEFAPFISSDGLTLYFVRRLGSPNQDDVYAAHRIDRNSTWQNPQPVDAVNTSAQEIDPSISADGLTFYFSRDSSGDGTADIYQMNRTCTTCNWGTPEPLNFEINTSLSERYPRVTPDGQILYFSRGGTMNIYISTKQ